MKVGLNKLRNAGDYLTLYNWDMAFINSPRALGQIDSESLNLRCQSSTLPKATGEDIEVRIRGFRDMQPGIYTPEGTITLTFVETDNMVIHDLINRWRTAAYNTENGVAASKADIQADLRLTRYDRAGNPIYHYDLFGCFINDHEAGGDLAETGGDVARPTITLTYIDFKEIKV